ncbi:type I-F CRISPR-associated protein Csy1 [Algiphilus sp.]|uniref:type I-F CRISPR-associated protein Csy1 n=1 Tax=Algiphilus sp. TaxID=1872431 RepID=UPI0032EBEBFC
MNEPSARTAAFRTAIGSFIEARRDAKLKGKNEDATTASKYAYDTWLADAARRVGQIQAVTHVLKATHPDARGSSMHFKPSTLTAHAEVGTHVLGDDYAEDVVGNAAALDVFKFLKIEVEGRRLLDWIQAGDPDLALALSKEPDTAQSWMQAFGELVRSETQPVSHETAKQLYWCTGEEPADNGDYQLLQPLFSSSLAHAVHADIQEARFGEANKEARQAHRERKASDTDYRDYRGLVARKLGGTKPQNISQLNSERGGINYLLASLPPHWKAQKQARSLLGGESAIDRFTYFGPVRSLVRHLAQFLLSDPPPNAETREKRECIEQAIGQELPVFAATIRASHEAGWTRDERCHLPQYEKLWLDPDRTELPIRDGHEEEDQKFIDDYYLADWPSELANRFGAWLTARLVEAGLKTAGDSEFHHFARQAIVDAQWPVPMQLRAGGRT